MMQHATVGGQSETAAGTAAAGFADLDEELQLDEIPVTGERPACPRGELTRVPPAKFDIDSEKPIRHWFDGLAMLHRFGIVHGRVSYANRFLRSKAYERAQSEGTIGVGFATDPCRQIFKRV